ncbi:MAG: 2-oxoacid:acceptor oxidoreductase family protein [Eggerthellaceae bacterium]|nr:2-oxoacid:acceptor oxidoreductase family protein [Eggerthellaceae bacterium]
MEEMRIVFAGFGGQGLLFAGKVVAYAGLLDGHEVSWLPSYGPEMRGGTANCSVTLSDEPIGSPLIMNPNVLVAMNQPSLLKFENEVSAGGIALVDTALVTRIPEREDIAVHALEATNMAEEAKLKGLANIVLVGKMLKETGFCSEETIEAAIKKAVPPSKTALIEKNIQALKLGMQA